MDLKHDIIFQDFETILKKVLEYSQEQENEEKVNIMFENIGCFQQIKKEIEEYEKTLKSHSRPLRIGFVGGFSTGKSSMINSLLGEEILGVKLEPATSQITELSYGSKFEVLEVTKDQNSYLSYEEISLKEYQKKSTTRVDRHQKLSHYIIKYPSQNLSRFTITDTPGFSSTSKEDDELTKNWINNLDLLIWIFDANKVGDKKEYDKIKEIRNNTKVIGVINKIDTKSPGVRDKIRTEVLNEELLDDVYFYSSKKVLGEFTKRNSFNDTLKNITAEIKNGINNSEEFEIKKLGSDLVFKSPKTSIPFGISPIKKTGYTEYYDTLINKIDNVRNTEINLILNQKLIKQYDDFRNLIKDELFNHQNVLTKNVHDQNNKISEIEELIKGSKLIYEKLSEEFETKIGASFKVFNTSFFDELGEFLFVKNVDSGIFSDDIYLYMKNLYDENFQVSLHEFISQEFHSYLEESFNIYENVIKNSVLAEHSKIQEIREDEYHLIRTLADGLVNSSVAAIIGYHRNFERDKKVESYMDALEFHKTNIDLVVPDELLVDSIFNLLLYDLIDAKSTHYLPLLEYQLKKTKTLKTRASQIISLIDNLLLKLN